MSALRDLARVFARIGILSFGGPAAQISLMHREVVERRAWVGEDEYLSALSFCMLLPGPEAMQLATWIGWRRAGVLGGLISGGLFVLPGAVIVLALAAIYASFGDVGLVKAAFVGVQAAVLAVVIEALLRLSRRALQTPAHLAIAGAAFASLYLANVPFPVVILAAALAGAVWLRAGAKAAAADVTQRQPPRATGLPIMASARAALIWGAVWLLPLAALITFAPPILADLALFFSKLAVFTFGGAYAVLSWMTSEVVVQRGWLSAPQMLDALALAETTPGPLILVTEFVAYLAAHSAGGLLMGLAGAGIALWMTFAPCFLWIFAGAPWMAHVQSAPRLSAALSGIMAAVVGVIAHLSLWFALNVLFASSFAPSLGPIQPLLPDLASIRALPALLALLAGYLLLRRHWPLAWILLLSAAVSCLASLL
ncbi:MAG: chromate efflux transporter [Cypionkella sp.]